ncbi:hypothetical protein [Aeromicrobium sp. CTD01-1L150]|uniref:hypothetical protein n=1 Tax=Aeromicrobium sp. CTD01-1L150 TaxID=3341830 RepID=UPI0035C06CB8
MHGAQEVHVGGPLPTSGSATLTTRITDVWDKRKAAVIWQEGVAKDPGGTELWRVRSSIFVRGEGGWGGGRGQSTAATVPDYRARFAGVVFPGETLSVNAWDEPGASW